MSSRNFAGQAKYPGPRVASSAGRLRSWVPDGRCAASGMTVSHSQNALRRRGARSKWKWLRWASLASGPSTVPNAEQAPLCRRRRNVASAVGRVASLAVAVRGRGLGVGRLGIDALAELLQSGRAQRSPPQFGRPLLGLFCPGARQCQPCARPPLSCAGLRPEPACACCAGLGRSFFCLRRLLLSLLGGIAGSLQRFLVVQLWLRSWLQSWLRRRVPSGFCARAPSARGYRAPSGPTC